MYRQVGTPDLIPEIQQMLIDKKHIHLTKQETYSLLRLHFGNIKNVLRKEESIYWHGRFKLIPNILHIMRKKLRRKRQFIKLMEYENSNG